LLITGEYAVLDGAKALAVPTRFGQSIKVKPYSGADLIWTSLDKDGNKWFDAQISLYDFSIIASSDAQKAKILSKILKNAVRLNSEFLDKWNSFKVESKLEFPLDWGLGSSSTLIYLIAEWADVHPMELYFKVENGSGYDVACAGADSPIEYFCNEEEISYTPIDFIPPSIENISFVHLGKKKSSSEGIKEYLSKVKNKKKLVESLTVTTEDIIKASSTSELIKLIDLHENTIHQHTGFEKVKDQFFQDFDGSVKSLGAWGGDFVMMVSKAGNDYISSYCKSKDFKTVLTYEEMVWPDCLVKA
jgi:mevalonate kinase